MIFNMNLVLIIVYYIISTGLEIKEVKMMRISFFPTVIFNYLHVATCVCIMEYYAPCFTYI